MRGLSLYSYSLGLSGKADVVEFRSTRCEARVQPHRDDAMVSETPFPIEYKRGKPKRHDADLVQLCAQAICLEEMLGLSPGGVAEGALYYGATRRRLGVPFDQALRARTAVVAARLHALIASGVTPRAIREKKCDRCSLRDLCLPEGTAPGRSAQRYIERTLADMYT